MDLWIRSQDKKHLMKCEAIMYEKTGTGYGLRAFTKNYDFNIATYKSIERALEVLDEIQNVIRSKYATSFDYEKAFSSFKKEDANYMLKQMAVYEMPKE